ncbi:hypothetical protein SAMN05216517_108195 [Janthinobacterium sp. OK676]|uniref:hypothetical protein n=1 Tax=Janthinobacterium sp. OK676 TaxID=1855295 RepID=UPI000889FFC1|nr:hypothetical protein [Janthinobacterium sp. OK676]SDN14039.1 hypothetical protein SAMN05216517_108195 [Janthinobacterium sp. OK676]
MLATVLVLEAILQCLPVSSGLRLENSDPQIPFRRYLAYQSYVYSYGWALNNARSGVINAQGASNSRDFKDGAAVLVLGDSFVESLMLDYSDTMQGQLEHALGGGVYAAGNSGNGLADTLAMARYYLPRVHPRTVVLFVDGSNLATLLEPAKRGHNQIEAGPVGLHMVHTPYMEPKMKRVVSYSALARYCYYNLKLPDWLSSTLRRKSRPQAAPLPVRDTAALALVLDYYLTQLRAIEGSSKVQFLFLVDGERGLLYDARKGEPSWQVGDRAFFLDRLKRHGYAAIDMQTVFARHWAAQRERMDFAPMDAHWNKVSHTLAAQQILSRLK